MNETRGNARTKPMRGGLKGGEINSLKDSEKTNKNNLYTYIIPIGLIHNFDELFKIENEAFDRTCSLDLLLIRKFYFLIDKCLFIIGPDASDCLQYYYMSHEDYFNLKTSQKEYIKEHY